MEEAMCANRSQLYAIQAGIPSDGCHIIHVIVSSLISGHPSPHTARPLVTMCEKHFSEDPRKIVISKLKCMQG